MDTREDGEIEYWKLNKALYGLKQAGHEWFKTLEQILAMAGLHQLIGDEGTYTNKDYTLILGTHVDDLVGIAPNEAILNQLEEKAEEHIELEKRGKPANLLGMELQWNAQGTRVIMTQQSLIESMAAKYLSNISSTKHSLPLNPALYAASEVDFKEPTLYQAIIGGLLYISRMTRPEIAIHVNLLGRRASKPSEENYKAAIMLLQYLQSSKSIGIKLEKPINLQMTIYADASYGGEEARSQTGVLSTLGNQPIGWYSRRQDVVSLSITEAEYIATCEAAKDAAWAKQFLEEIGITLKPSLKTDSEGSFNLAQTSRCLRRTRHIEHRYHYIRQQVQKDNLSIATIPGKTTLRTF
jgi:hypothetical protein